MRVKDKLEKLEEKLNKGFKEAYKKMVEFKRYKKSPIIVSKDGKIVKIDPFDVEIND